MATFSKHFAETKKTTTNAPRRQHHPHNPAKAAHPNFTRPLPEQIPLLIAALDGNKDKCAQLQEELATTRQQLHQEQAAHGTSSTVCETLNAHLEDLTYRLTSAQEESAINIHLINSIQQTITHKQEDKILLTQRLQEVLEDKKAVQEELEGAKHQQAERTIRIQSLQDDLAAQKATIAALQQQLLQATEMSTAPSSGASIRKGNSMKKLVKKLSKKLVGSFVKADPCAVHDVSASSAEGSIVVASAGSLSSSSSSSRSSGSFASKLSQWGSRLSMKRFGSSGSSGSSNTGSSAA